MIIQLLENAILDFLSGAIVGRGANHVYQKKNKYSNDRGGKNNISNSDSDNDHQGYTNRTKVLVGWGWEEYKGVYSNRL